MDWDREHVWKHRNMALLFAPAEEGGELRAFQPAGLPAPEGGVARPLVSLAVSGEGTGTLHTTTHSSYALPRALKTVEIIAMSYGTDAKLSQSCRQHRCEGADVLPRAGRHPQEIRKHW